MNNFGGKAGCQTTIYHPRLFPEHNTTGDTRVMTLPSEQKTGFEPRHTINDTEHGEAEIDHPARILAIKPARLS